VQWGIIDRRLLLPLYSAFLDGDKLTSIGTAVGGTGVYWGM